MQRNSKILPKDLFSLLLRNILQCLAIPLWLQSAFPLFNVHLILYLFSVFCVMHKWKQLSLLWQHFETETDDLAGVRWSPDSEVLCIWDSSLTYKVLLYTLDGRLISSYSAYQHALGVKSLGWSPSGQFLAVGSFDQKVSAEYLTSILCMFGSLCHR